MTEDTAIPIDVVEGEFAVAYAPAMGSPTIVTGPDLDHMDWAERLEPEGEHPVVLQNRIVFPGGTEVVFRDQGCYPEIIIGEDELIEIEILQKGKTLMNIHRKDMVFTEE